MEISIDKFFRGVTEKNLSDEYDDVWQNGWGKLSYDATMALALEEQEIATRIFKRSAQAGLSLSEQEKMIARSESRMALAKKFMEQARAMQLVEGVEMER